MTFVTHFRGLALACIDAHFVGLFETYKMYALLHRSEPNILVRNDNDSDKNSTTIHLSFEFIEMWPNFSDIRKILVTYYGQHLENVLPEK